MSGQRDDPAWHAARAKVVGGSEIAALFDCQPDYAMSRYALWHVKAGLAPPPEVSGDRPAWGVRLEAVIAEAAAEQEGWKIHKGGHVVDPECAGLGATLDYVIDSGAWHDEDGPGPLECKNVDWMAHRSKWTKAEPPLHILLQHQTQLAVTGYAWGAIAALVGGNQLEIYRYMARPKLIAEIRRRVTEFWQSIAENRPPPIDGSDSASAVLRALYAEAQPEPIDLSASNEWPEAAAQFLAAQAARKTADANYNLARNRVESLIDGHTEAFGCGYRASVAVSPARPDRPAEPGEIINGRAETRRITVKESA